MKVFVLKLIKNLTIAFAIQTFFKFRKIIPSFSLSLTMVWQYW